MKIKKIIRLIAPKKIGIIGLLVFYVFLLLGQALVIPLLPYPGKLLLDRYRPGQENQTPAELAPESSPSSWNPMTDSWMELHAYLNQLPMEGFVWRICLIIGLLGLVLALLRLGEGLLAARMNRRIFFNLRDRLNEKIMTRKLGYLNSKKKVDLLGRVSTDVEKLQQVVGGGLSTIFKSIPTIILTIFAMLMVDWMVTLIFLSVIPVLYGAAFSLTSYLQNSNRRLRESNNSYQEYLLQAYSFFSMTKSLRSEKTILDSLKQSNKKALRDYFRTEQVASLFYSSLILSKSLIRAIVLLVGFFFIIKGRITLGDFFLFFALLEALIYPIDEISRFTTKWSKTLVSIDRIDSLLSEMKDEAETSGQFHAHEEFAKIEFNDVDFRYNEDSDLILKDFSLELSGPRLVGIIGPSGCGKSTFMSLFNGLYRPEKGQIVLNGGDLMNWDLQSLRERVLFIGQESFLMAGTILDNIRLANPNCDEDLAWKALARVNADGFVKKLPQELKTPIGEGGQGLSGGQSRRVSLARGFSMPDAQICLFDEPTAGLDPDSGHQVVRSIKEYSKNSLVLFSTHRLDELEHVDALIVFSHNQAPRYIKKGPEFSEVTRKLDFMES